MASHSHTLTPKVKAYTLLKLFSVIFRCNSGALGHAVKKILLKATLSRFVYVTLVFHISHYKIQSTFPLFEGQSRWFSNAEANLLNNTLKSLKKNKMLNRCSHI